MAGTHQPHTRKPFSDFPGGSNWIRIHLPMQGTRVRSLAWEDSTCHEKPSSCATTTEVQVLQSLQAATMEACAPRAGAPQ